MSGTNEGDPPDSYGRLLGDLVQSGWHWLKLVSRQGGELCFSTWAKSVTKAAEDRGERVSEEEIEWLWNALTNEPRFKATRAGLVVSPEDEWKRRTSVKVLPRGSEFGIFLKLFPFRTTVPSKALAVKPDAIARIDAPLWMKPGKASHYECKSVLATVSFRPKDVKSAADEAAMIRLKEEAVTVDNGHVTVKVESLNQAYSVTSLRLEPQRRSHGGTIYQHVAWLDGQILVPIDAIRQQVKDGSWEFPELTPREPR